MTPRVGDFGLTRIGGLGGRLIRIGQFLNGDGFADYEHAFIVAGDYGGRQCVIEAQPGGVRLVYNEYPDSETVYSSWDLSTRQRNQIVTAARGMIGTPYSWLDYASIGLRRLGIRPHFVQAYVASSRHVICSQLVDYAYAAAFLPLFAQGFPGDVTPAKLLQVLKGSK